MMKEVYCLRPPAGANSFPVIPLPGTVAITINASDVVLDLNGYTLTNPGANNNGYIGVYSNIAGGVHNVTVRNGTIVGFTYGVFMYTPNLDYSQNYSCLLEDLHISAAGTYGINLCGGGHTVRRCRVELKPPTGTLYSLAIRIFGPGARVIDSDTSDLIPTAANTYTYGITFSSGTDCLAVGNRVNAVTYGILYDASSGKYRDNLMGSGVAIPYSGGTNAGNNN